MPYDSSSSLWSGECFIVRHHTKSMLVDHENEEYWIPYSQIHDDSELYEKTSVNEDGKLVIPLWLAEKAGWV